MCVCVCVCVRQLLAPEVRREHNAVLQCVRHVVKESFFGIGEHDKVGQQQSCVGSDSNPLEVKQTEEGGDNEIIDKEKG